ncbi:hypothetical protein K493DRAFT_86576 [Basidiobolus meristosporus CBS 931.73]|uniref:Uncharacterized protein n=1 Tax=Basidiobolus meristosporus CBS 931.73 TaxID=1314790 RepID=A0A1Y1YVR9_9FUNG|nr:hypothetical protein K493DRAFT_86576 [Basidiobolus meristosporus CBS 931.73]|eukprot:ORY02163.1 hypothetical protein K493DRAFT_86576 [Basidiobolus meristosporus CBS 931.73]
MPSVRLCQPTSYRDSVVLPRHYNSPIQEGMVQGNGSGNGLPLAKIGPIRGNCNARYLLASGGRRHLQSPRQHASIATWTSITIASQQDRKDGAIHRCVKALLRRYPWCTPENRPDLAQGLHPIDMLLPSPHTRFNQMCAVVGCGARKPMIRGWVSIKETSGREGRQRESHLVEKS